MFDVKRYAVLLSLYYTYNKYSTVLEYGPFHSGLMTIIYNVIASCHLGANLNHSFTPIYVSPLSYNGSFN